MNNKFLGYFILLLAMILSGLMGYSFKGFTMENNKKEVATNQPKSNEIQSSNVDLKNDNFLVGEHIVYWIDGVQRKDTQSIIYNGKVFAPVEYIAQSMGVPFQFQQSENLVRLGYSMNERIFQEKFLISDNVSFLKLGMSFDQVKNILGKPLSSNKSFNECTSNNEMIAEFKDLEILFIYDITDKKYFVSDITVLSENIETEKGISIGSSAEDLIKVYGELAEFSGIEYLRVTEGFSGDGLVRYGIKESLWFELKKGKIVRFGIKQPHC